ncbi:MAG: signal peptidase I [Burkholderiales bacterium]|nr:signal peptidase I [Burkholderiales bacterium]
MAPLTGILYACLVFYGAGWYMGKWSGNFSFLLFVLTVVTLAYWLAERFVFLPRRVAAADALGQQDAARRAELGRLGISDVDGNIEHARHQLLAQPWWLDWTAGLFPVILMVFVLRSFLFEPFKIPSGSMIPTLEIGDLILVNKFHYGVRLPVINKKIIPINTPQRGDVMVFRYPVDPSIDFIKRVVAVPGDEVSYLNQRLYLNGKQVPLKQLDDYYDENLRSYSRQFEEGIGPNGHRLLVEPRLPSNYGSRTHAFPYNENCRYTPDGVTCKVPAGHYFMMGDNRDNSEDSRFWGFVPDENIVGRAFFVWMNFGNLKRIGTFH